MIMNYVIINYVIMNCDTKYGRNVCKQLSIKHFVKIPPQIYIYIYIYLVKVANLAVECSMPYKQNVV